MSSHRRVKDIAYDEDELYSDEDETYDDDQGYSAEDKQNFADLTPVVQAHLVEADVQASTREIEEALWHYYWDVAKSVEYIKKQHSIKLPLPQAQKQSKAKDKFDQAAERHAVNNGKSDSSHYLMYPRAYQMQTRGEERQRLMLWEDNLLPLSSLPPKAWFEGVPWNDVPYDLVGKLSGPAISKPMPKLLGGSSKLAKLAEERRRKAEAAKSGFNDTTNTVNVSTTLSSLDKLTLNKTDGRPEDQSQNRKYAPRKKREASPPPITTAEMPQEEKELLPDLRAAPSDFGRTLSRSFVQGREQRMSVRELIGDFGPVEAFERPSPDDVVLKAHGQRPPKQVSSNKAVSKSTPKDAPTSITLEARANLPDAIQLWKKARTAQRPFASFVVAGHVDHGKSTLMGRLLLDTGAVQQRDIDKFKKQAAEIGKESFALAWVMDTGSEERERGVTVDIAQHNFSTEKADFTILDAPGHRDFVPNMIGGASMADMIVLVVDANQLESGIKGQTREHVQLAYGVGIRKAIVAINKLDISNPPWSQDLFNDVKAEIQMLLRKVGFAEKNTMFVPCSGLNGENVANVAQTETAAAKVRGDAPSLVAALESFAHDDASTYAKADQTSTVQDKAVNAKSLRLQVADVYRGGIQNPLSVSGRITAGSVVEGSIVTILTSNDQALVKGIDRAGERTEWAVALQIVALHLDGDVETLSRNLRAGDLICSTAHPANLIKTVTAKVQVLDTILPQAVELHFGRLHVAASIRRLVATLDVTGEQLKKSPRSLKQGQIARVEVALSERAALEPSDRIILRSDGMTIAFGIIESVIS